MSKFCGKCGSKLDETTGLCPQCDQEKLKTAKTQAVTSPVQKPQVQQPPVQRPPVQKQPAQQPPVQRPPVQRQSVQKPPVQKPQEEKKNLAKSDKSELKKMDRKQRKKQKRAEMPLGKKIKRFFIKFFAILLSITIVVSAGSCALQYFNIIDIPFLEKVLDFFGFGDEEQVENNFASISGKFTDSSITDSDEAIKAAQSVASQLGLQTATDELALKSENKVGNLTYYRLQENYYGMPVYGKTIVVVSDENGEAKGITSNAVDVKNANGKKQTKATDSQIKDTLGKYLTETYYVGTDVKKVSDVKFEKSTTDDCVLYDCGDEFRYACEYSVTCKTDDSPDSLVAVIDIYSGEVLSCTAGNYTEIASATGNNSDGQEVSFNVSLNDNKYSLVDEKRCIAAYDCKNQVLNGFVLDDGTAPEIPTSDDNKWTDTDANTVYYNASLSYDFYDKILGVRGFLKKGDGTSEDNLKVFYHNTDSLGAYANSGIMVISFENAFSLSTVGHEYTHIVEGNISGMEYENESGAIMEGYSDLFGELIEDYGDDLKLNNSCDWENDYRCIHDPGSRNYPSDAESELNNVSNYSGPEDYVHGCSTIVSRAAYLMSNGVDGNKTALSNQEIANLWYHTLCLLPQDCTYATLRKYMSMTAENLGYSDDKQECVAAAFDEVRVYEDVENREEISTRSTVKVYDKNGLLYDDYVIVIDGKEYSGAAKTGILKKDYHKEIKVKSAEEYDLKLNKGDYSITIVDNFSGNKTYEKLVKVRENQSNNKIEFATAFGYDYSVNVNSELNVKDVNEVLYDNYDVSITGTDSEGTEVEKNLTVTEAQAQQLDLGVGKYKFMLTDKLDSSKVKLFSVRVRNDAPSSMLSVRTTFGKPYGEYDKENLPNGVKEFNGHYYYVYNLTNITTFDDAQQFCLAQNGYLATLTTAEENDFAYSLIQQANLTAAYFGLHDEGNDNWKWINNEKFDYSNWADGEPSSYSEYYGMFYTGYAEKWNDGDFGGTDHAFICEWGPYEVETSDDMDFTTTRETSGERDIVLCLDVSGSMSGDKLEQTKEASIKFVNTVLQEDASIAVVVYDDSARVLSDFSQNEQNLVSIIEQIGTGGSTNIDDGLIKSYELLNYSNANKKIIVLMSDGEPNSGRVGEELISYADSIKDNNVYIYTLGFFGEYSGQSAAQTLMERIASDGCHYEVSDADSLVYFFGDIADTINGQQYIYIRIACPVDVTVSYGGETLTSEEDDLSVRTSFGTLTFEENTSENGDVDEGETADDRVKVLRLKADDSYDISIEGTGRGRMNYTIGFMDENGVYSDMRKFRNIKITRDTQIDTEAKTSGKTTLYVDEDGDGKYDLTYRAGENGVGELVDYTYLWYIAIACAVVILLIILALIIKSKRKKKKRG